MPPNRDRAQLLLDWTPEFQLPLSEKERCQLVALMARAIEAVAAAPEGLEESNAR